uniref:Uncharacterized protein n=1 Tax=Glossina pallidipes TaxID=7398 RepID=A0A1A9ZJY2_GLOPL
MIRVHVEEYFAKVEGKGGIQVDNYDKISSPAIKYVGVMVNVAIHIDIVCEKQKRIYANLRGVIANIGGPRQKQRLLLSTVEQSIFIYADTITILITFFSFGSQNPDRVKRIIRKMSPCRVCDNGVGSVLAESPEIVTAASQQRQQQRIPLG